MRVGGRPDAAALLLQAQVADQRFDRHVRARTLPGHGGVVRRREIGQNVGRSIARADVADAILATLADPGTIGHTVGIGY
ncbi:MAG TPA: hypothetical protein VG268_18885 [Streptosporangiaceae bacterium]|nr:hypothetical protein [Streptosporangiaceae bacterium]